MPVISGKNVPEIEVEPNGEPVIITVKFKPDLPTLIDITATSTVSGTLGQAFINDGDPTNNTISIDNLSSELNGIIWLRIIVHHPGLEKYDFAIFVSQGDNTLTTYEEKGSLEKPLIYEGFILKKDV